MREFWKRKKVWFKLILLIMFVSLFFNVRLFTDYREGRLAQKEGIHAAMNLVQSSDSQLNMVIRTIEDEAEFEDILVEIGNLRQTLAEATGTFQGIGRYSGTANSMDAHEIWMTFRAFEYYLFSELTYKWQEDGVAVKLSREEALTELRSMKLDLSALAKLGQETRNSTYNFEEFSAQWAAIMEERIQQDPNTFVHSQLH